MEGSERLLRHFKKPDKKPDKNQNRQYSAEDHEAVHEQSEYPPEFHHDHDDRTISTNRPKQLKNSSSEPSPPPSATGETGEDLLLGLELEENETGARDDRAIETEPTEQDLENLSLLEKKKSGDKIIEGEKKSGGEKKRWRKKRPWRKKKRWEKKMRSRDEKKSEDKKSGDETLPPSSENLDLLEEKKSEGETGAYEDRAIETEPTEQDLENLSLLEKKKSGDKMIDGEKKSEGEKKRWRKKRSWRKKKRWEKKMRSRDEKKSEDKESEDKTLPQSSENLSLLEKKKSGGEKESGGETGARDDKVIETNATEKGLEDLLLLEEEEKKSQGKKKSRDKKKGRRKKKSKNEKKSEDQTLPPSSENLDLLKEKKTSGGETGAPDDRTIELHRMQENLQDVLLQKEEESWDKSLRRKRWREKMSGGGREKIEGIVWADSPGSPGAKRLPILLREKDAEAGQKREEGEEGGPEG